ncbi:hypothetical protein ACHAQJ_008103 [Trichoderma viride]
MFETFDATARGEALSPYALSPVPNIHHAPKKSFTTLVTGLVSIPGLGLLTTNPTGAMNAALVFRTWGLTKQEPSLQSEFYGPAFSYQEFMKARNVLMGMATHYTMATVTGALVFSPLRSLIRKFVFKPGEGPNKGEAKKDRIEYKGVAIPDTSVDMRKRAFGRLTYTGSMYYSHGI